MSPLAALTSARSRRFTRPIERLVADGMAVMLISSDLEEVLRLSDRIVVLRRGRVAATLSRAEASETAIMRAAALAA